MTGRLSYRVVALGAATAFAFTAATAQASLLYDQAVLDLDAIGYWKLDGNADDSSGNAHHGVATNITWLGDGPDPAAPGAGRGDGCLQTRTRCGRRVERVGIAGASAGCRLSVERRGSSDVMKANAGEQSEAAGDQKCD